MYVVILWITITILCFTIQTGNCDQEQCLADKCDEMLKLKYFPKMIIFWTTFFGIKDFSFGLGQQPFIDAGCSVTNCILTTDKNDVKEADAVIFHIRNVDKRMEWPKERKEMQM